MYVAESMIELGLKGGQQWPSAQHRSAAITLAIGNRWVCNRDTLIEVVQAVIAVPAERLKTITLRQLQQEFGCPQVWAEVR